MSSLITYTDIFRFILDIIIIRHETKDHLHFKIHVDY